MGRLVWVFFFVNIFRLESLFLSQGLKEAFGFKENTIIISTA